MKRKQKRDQAKTKAKKIYFFIIICHKSNKRNLKIFYWNNSMLPCEQRLHFRGMRWRAKSSLCRQPFNFLSCMRKIRHAIRKQLVRQICVSFAAIKLAKTPCEQHSSSFCFVFLLCPSGPKYFSRYMSWDRLLRKHYATNCSKSCLIWGEHI